MNNIETARQIAARIADGGRDFGRVRIKQCGPYLLLNYKPEAMWGEPFTEAEKACRGLVIREDGKIMALPMPKFFNLGEPQCPPLPDEPYTVWDKADGSLAIFWHDGRRWRCNTRGSFANLYVARALWHWKQASQFNAVSPDLTVMCEVMIRDDPMPRVIDAPPGLYLLAARDRSTGEDIPIGGVPAALPMPIEHVASIKGLLARREQTEGLEGWVVRFESGLRVKIKTTWYLRMFRAMQTMTPKRIRELMVERDDWLGQFPDDLQAEAKVVGDRIVAAHDALLAQVRNAYIECKDSAQMRKDFALRVMRNHRDISHWLFLLYDDRFDEKALLAKMELPT